MIHLPRSRLTLSFRSGRINMILLVGVFAVGVGAVYYLGTRKIQRQKSFTATASIQQESTEEKNPSIKDIRGQILSDSHLRGAIRQLQLSHKSVHAEHGTKITANMLNRLRRDVKVSTTPGPASGWLGITISCRGKDAQRVMRLANFLAMQYRQQFLAQKQASACDRHAAASSAAEEAREEVVKRQQQLDATITQHLQPQSSLAPRESPSPPEPVTVPPRETNQPAQTTINPQWLDLETKLSHLQQQRAELLLTRTPLHPEVEKVALEIGELKQQLATIERHLPAKKTLPPPQSANTVVKKQSTQKASSQASQKLLATLVQKMEKQREALASAQRRHARLARAEREAWQARFQLPQINVELARECTSTQAPFVPTTRLILLALAVGLAMAGGVGLAWTVASGEAVFASVTEVRAALGAPVAGTLSWPSSGSRRHVLSAVSWFLMMAGGILIVLATLALVAVYQGHLAV